MISEILANFWTKEIKTDDDKSLRVVLKGISEFMEIEEIRKTGNMWFRAFYYGKSVSKTNRRKNLYAAG